MRGRNSALIKSSRPNPLLFVFYFELVHSVLRYFLGFLRFDNAKNIVEMKRLNFRMREFRLMEL